MRRSLLFAAAALTVAAHAASASAQATTKPCPSVASSAQCVTFDTALDHSGATPGTQRLGYALVPATGAKRGTLAVLAGGPGQSATAIGPRIVRLLAPLRRSFDLLLVDQRGTGLSGALSCPGLDATGTPEAIARCGESLGPARAFYTASEDAADLDDIRATAGVDKLSVLGISAGARVAGVYARMFPSHLDRLVLDSPEPVEGSDALASVRALALPRVLREVCWPPSCRGFLAADPLTAVAQLSKRLRARRLTGTVIEPSGRPHHASLTATGFYTLTALSDLDPFVRTRLPSAVAAALRGDSAPLLRLGADTESESSSSDAVNSARLLASDCIDSRLPWDPASDPSSRPQALTAALRSRPASDFGPFSPVDVAAVSAAVPCLSWPSTPAPAPTGGEGPAVPVLIISGRDDLRTPLEDARRAASQYPNAKVLAIPSTGHSAISNDISGCALAGLTLFLVDGENDPGHCRRMERLPELFPYVPATAALLRPAAGLHGAAGRTATALGATLADAVREASEAASGTTAKSARTGGLRAGTLTVSLHGIRLSGYSLVKGVTVSGTLPLSVTKPSSIVVGGPDAVPGRFVMKGTRLTGTLGTQRVRLRVALK